LILLLILLTYRDHYVDQRWYKHRIHEVDMLCRTSSIVKHIGLKIAYTYLYIMKGVRVKVDRYYAIGSWPASQNRPPLARSAFCHPPSWRTSGVRGWLSLSTNPRATRLSRIINITVHPLKKTGAAAYLSFPAVRASRSRQPSSASSQYNITNLIYVLGYFTEGVSL